MATSVAPPGVEDDEAWLYGGGGEGNVSPKENTASNGQLSASAEPFVPQQSDVQEASAEAGELEEGESGVVDGEEEEDSDDDDDVQITIGDIKTSYEPAKNLFKGGAYQKTPHKAGTAPVKGVDLNAQGEVQGVNIYEFDISTLGAEEKPWRKPGADITDYFNYGFNEETWQKYCEKQKYLRIQDQPRKIFVHHAGTAAPREKTQQGNIITINQTSTSTIQTVGTNINLTSPTSSYNQPIRRISGTIDVVSSRRPEEQTTGSVQVVPPTTSWDSASGVSQPVSYPMTVPPPTGPTMAGLPIGPPPGFMQPPPRVPPPTHPTNMPPPGYGQPPMDGYYPPAGPPPGYNPVYNPNIPPPFNAAPPPSTGPAPWSDRPPFDDPYARGPTRSPGSDSNSEAELASRYRERERESRDRDRDRDRGDRDYERRRERSRSRDRERRHRKRRHRDEDEEHRHRHKKSKRSRREREDESAPQESTEPESQEK